MGHERRKTNETNKLINFLSSKRRNNRINGYLETLMHIFSARTSVRLFELSWKYLRLLSSSTPSQNTLLFHSSFLLRCFSGPCLLEFLEIGTFLQPIFLAETIDTLFEKNRKHQLRRRRRRNNLEYSAISSFILLGFLYASKPSSISIDNAESHLQFLA